ncbi:hypothetical protein MSNKSG1_16021 [Marinobacter santoriniensis NKSG1]|uniref:Lipoprotein n=1 Tax=Marinobacter santoriniensis NKSG1 TaxID=1288826 RepID=M7CQW9_9GAMM|nr:hypothetical protein [Marinobacter santoriniensis]EMP54480.1 hypothetical protein MSNKSG1_16021 [Marinobacter santoriniensis NKSG1]
MTVMARKLMIATSLVGFLLTGCTTAPPDEQISVADSSEALGYEKPDWQTPFWERNRTPEASEAEAAPPPQASPSTDGVLRANIGIVVGENVSPGLETALRNKATRYGFIPVPTSALRDAARRIPECSDLRSLACARALAVYPGVRLMMIVKNRELTLIDPSAGAIYPSTELPSDNPADAALKLAAERSTLSPWVLRAFPGDDGQLYISAGSDNGVTPGTELTVHEPGTLVRAPSGQPVAWRPGKTIGKARVVELVGSNLAVVVSKSGTSLTPDMDLLISR